ncbi:hypothetical protein PHLCEN_2v11963 [Hermanssonia centrifuga]|uniref:Uncharacterized protein n=1 Tax=Hermanssonia centrifuga TaxID=98765 RepID=A0A2R6NIQ0_9APHY|nr:hypothetical protein PHLCEN_2v11963 [Hermanssonia centrifuga]
MSNEADRRLKYDRGPVATLMDRKAPDEVKDEARDRLEQLQGSVEPNEGVSAAYGTQNSNAYDGQKAAQDVINTGRHTG